MTNPRNKGNSFERLIMNEYKEWFPMCVTSRNESKILDSKKVDLCYTDPFSIQCKNYTSFSGAKIMDTLKSMPVDKNINIIHLKLTRKGEVVCLDKDKWYKIVKFLIKHKFKID